MTRPFAAVCLAAASALALSGCISLIPETEPDALYRLEPRVGAPAGRAADAEPVLIDRVAAPRGLAGDRIAIAREGRIGYVAGAAWLAPAPQMLRQVVVDAIRAGTPWLAPTRSEDGVQARYRLDLDLRRFEAVYDQGEGRAPNVVVALEARLIDGEARTLAAVDLVRAERRAAANRQGAIVDAFSEAVHAVGLDLAAFAAEAVCGLDDPPAACAERP